MDTNPAPPPIPIHASAVGPQKPGWRQFVSVLLSICLILFIADAALSVLDDGLGLAFRFHGLRGLRTLAGFFAMLLGVLIYLLMAFTPAIPKRVFAPVALYAPIAGLITIPVLVYYYDRQDLIGFFVSILQLAVGLFILRLLKRKTPAETSESGEPGSPQSAHPGKGWFAVVPIERLRPVGFTWAYFASFVAVNLLVLLPAVLIYLFCCGSLAVGHLSQGFVKLNTGGLTTQARTYTRSDGKTVQLVPMAHVGDANFYKQITHSFPSNSVILMEGVRDDLNLLTNKVSYHRMAKTLGLSEQQKEFQPVAGEWVNADIDIREFSSTTIDLLNLLMLVHAKGVNPETLLPLTQYSPPPDIQTQIWDDLLHKRNRHLLGELKDHLADYDYVVIPWGAAHMPELAAEIQKSGFKLSARKDYRVIRFH